MSIPCALSLIAGLAAILATPPVAHALDRARPVTVSIGGEVRKPGTYTLPPGSPLSALLLAAGGFTDNAFLRGAVLTRASLRDPQETELREMAARMAPETGPPEKSASAVQPLADLLRGLRPTGRIPVTLSHPRLLKGSPADVPLEEGDALRIPPKTGDVSVSGAVRSASRAVPYSENFHCKEYIARAGGYADDADRDHVYLLRADGTVALLSLGFLWWNPAASRWELPALTGATPAVGPGDTVVVSRRPPTGVPSKTARQLPGILMRAAEISGTPVTLP